HFDRNPRQLFDQELADEPGMPGGAARQNRNAPDSSERSFWHVDLFEKHRAGILRDASEERFARRHGLLEDLLEHEMPVAGLLGHGRIPHHTLRRSRDGTSEEVRERYAGPRNHRHFLVPEKNDITGVAEDGRNIRGDKEFAIAQANHDRRTFADRDNFFGI